MLRPTFIIIVLSLLTILLYSPLNAGIFHSDSAQPRILLLTAHPDDECLFFGPTLLSLEKTDAMIFALSLSTGNADGLGAVRIEEFHKSYETLGVPAERRWIVDHPGLQDNITEKWNPRIISQELMPYITSNDIAIVLTFDYAGISSHPNHISLPYGVAHLIQTLYALDKPTPRLYTLTTVPIFAKYTSILAPLVTKFDFLVAQALTWLRVFAGKENIMDSAISLANQATTLNARTSPVFVSGISEYFRALQAMRKHESQLLWFRWLYVTFSHYMWVNEWLEVQMQ
ncbi:hypothetical protein D9756_008965 [Leucocoprinus leucothites]|uniref:N-acetylglucosaminylphosphatidylinositol deacetylase n=1 Tax=Leucocoprinus leucothites TaxID=201217 RepID=A0A8H5FUJ4_9AGAR|nr:hypothetical protein D9756_008965 [Leucoagaricus leucothites]